MARPMSRSERVYLFRAAIVKEAGGELLDDNDKHSSFDVILDSEAQLHGEEQNLDSDHLACGHKLRAGKPGNLPISWP